MKDGLIFQLKLFQLSKTRSEFMKSLSQKLSYSFEITSFIRSPFKKILVLIAILLVQTGFGQEPPPFFKVNLVEFESADSLLANYNISTFSFRDTLQWEQIPQKPERLVFKKDGQYVFAYIYSEKFHSIKPGDILRFSLTNKISNETMHIFIRMFCSLSYEDEVILENVEFKKGVYFLDLLEIARKQKKSGWDCLEIKITLNDIKLKRLSLAKLDKLLRR